MTHEHKKLTINLVSSIVGQVLYTLLIIWLTLYVIRHDVANQLQKANEIKEMHIQDLNTCMQSLGERYEIN